MNTRRRTLLSLVFLLALAMTAAACRPRPTVTAIRYDYSNGSLPPPYHYEYEIVIGPEPEGTITMQPDYADQNPPIWTETFPVDPETLTRLLAQAELVATGPDRDDQELAAGGDYHALTFTVAEGEPLEALAMQGEPAQLAAEIRELVPQQIWDVLLARREEYELEQLEEGR